MGEHLINDFGWKFFENSKTLISRDDLEGQTLAIDARVWYSLGSSSPDDASNNINGNSFDLKLIFKQLHTLSVMQIRLLVVLQESIRQDDEHVNFSKRCIELLQAMSIPYIRVENVEDALVHLIKEKIAEGCLTEDTKVFLHGSLFAFRYSCLQLEIYSDKKPLHLTKYSTDSKRSSDHFQCFHYLSTFYLRLAQQHASECQINKNDDEKETNSSEGESHVQKARPFMARACKKPITLLKPQPPPKTKIKVKKKCPEKRDVINVQKATKSFDLALEKLLDLVLSWSENPLDRLKEFQRALAEKKFDHFSKTENDLIELFTSFTEKSLREMENTNFEELLPVKVEISEGLKVSGSSISWTRPEFARLHTYLQTNGISCPLRHQLGYLVAYDLFQLLKSHVSGDSYPEGISRPDRILKISKKNEVEMYTVKWHYIPGTSSVKPKDLITTELKNTFCAVFPKVASKFEGWSVNSGTDDDLTDMENICDDWHPIATPGSPKKCLKNRKRTRMDPSETPASTSSSGMKATVNQYFVAKKKLIFDSIK